MEAHSFTVSKVFQNGGDIHYLLPHFQREYAWERPEWETLLSDVCAIHDVMANEPAEEGTADELEHFLGSLVVVRAGTVAGTVPAFKLVDGQQRLTTLSLLLCAVERIVLASHPALAKKASKLLVNADEQGDIFYKLLPTNKYGDREAYKAVIRSTAIPTPTESRIPQAFDYLYQQIKAKIESGAFQPDVLFRAVTTAFQVVFIDLNQNESPYKIFESLNAKGKPLSQADLVRNFIAMVLPASGQEGVFCDHWQPIEQLLQEQRTVGRSGIGELTAFLRHYLALHSGVLTNEHHVYARFRDRINKDFQTPAALVQEIAVLHEYAVLYDRLLRPDRQPNQAIQTAMARLQVLDITTAYPFLLALSYANHSGQVSGEDFKHALALIENYLMRRFLAEEPTNYLNKMFPALWNQINHTEFLYSLEKELAGRNYPSDTRIRQKLMTRRLYRNNTATRAQVVFLLNEINVHLSHGTDGHTMLTGSATIEHILPQTLSEDWQTHLGPDAARHGEFIHAIGNLTLVGQEWNASLSNNHFGAKKAKLATHALLLNSGYFGQEISEWNEATIQSRSSFLIDEILEIWPSMRQPVENDPENAETTEDAAAFRPQMVDALSRYLNQPLVANTKRHYQSPDNIARVVIAVSKAYENGEYTRYWFAFTESGTEFLEAVEQGYVALGCGSVNHIVLLPLETLRPLLPQMSKTESAGRRYRHILIYAKNDRFYVGQPTVGNLTDVTGYLLTPD